MLDDDPPIAGRSPSLVENGGAAALTRRQLLVAGGAGAGALAFGGLLSACGDGQPPADFTIRAMHSEVELGARRAATFTYGGRLPGRELRLTQGKRVRIRLVNELDEPTTIHWHGLRLRNAADGVPGMTQKAVAAGEEFIYDFTPPDAGTYLFHSHVGTQLDRGLYAPLIVEPRRESLVYDRESVLMFDDWLDGLAGTPDQRLATPTRTPSQRPSPRGGHRGDPGAARRGGLSRADRRGRGRQVRCRQDVDLLIGPIVNRALATGGPLEPALAERLVDIVFGGLRAIDSSEGASTPNRAHRCGGQQR